jgi:hypothetical protein
MKVGFPANESDDTLYFRMQDKHMVVHVIYVDDLIITRNNEAHIKQVKEELKARFKMTDLGKLRYHLGVEVSQHPDQIFLSQTKYSTEFLKKFGMEDCKSSLTPMEQKLKLSEFEGVEVVNSTKYRKLVGSLIYLIDTQPDFSYSLSILSNFMQEPRDSHWNSTKRVLRYIQGTKYFGLLYKRNKNFTLVGYSDVDFVGDIDDRTSTSGYLMNMGSAVVSWNCKKRRTIVNSSVEAEYISTW